MPRVLLTGFCAVPGPRRAGVQLRHVIRSLTPLHTVDLLVVREGEQAYVERQGSVRVLRVPTHEAEAKAQIQAFQRALKRQLDGADYEVVHCRDAWSGMTVIESRDRLGYAVVYDLTRSPIGDIGLDAGNEAQYARDEEACILAADVVLAPTPHAVKALQGRGKPERVVLSPPGVDVDRFDWDEMPASSGPPRILYIGSIDPGRGVRVLVRAMAAVVREVDARLVLAGPMSSPKFEQALKDGIRELGLVDKVDVLGPVDHDQLPALIATSTVCVVPAAADLSPNPTIGYPTKLLEYMACRRAIVAPRRDTVQLVVDNNREALLFEPGDPIDLAKKILRLVGEPALRDRLATSAYERVRRDFTASGARRALRKAYDVIAERFAGKFDEADDSADDAPKVVLLQDDDFEATVFEEAPSPHNQDNTSVSDEIPLDEALSSLASDDNSSSESVIAPPPPSRTEQDETMERKPVAPPPPRDSGHWTAAGLATQPILQARPPGGHGRSGTITSAPPDDWVVTNVAAAVRALEAESEDADVSGSIIIDDGTPIEGVVAAGPALPMSEGNFVAGEIDVPTPIPDREDSISVEVDFTAASSLLGQPEADPDTGGRTPPIERR